MTVYRTAARMFEGSHLPLLYMGIEYLKTNNLQLSSQYLGEALNCCPNDPAIYHELGVVAYRQKQ